MDEYYIQILSNMGMISFIALSAYLLLVTGEISFGQQAFFAISAYASGIAYRNQSATGWAKRTPPFLTGNKAGETHRDYRSTSW